MTKCFVPAGVFMLAVISLGFAQELTVDYLDGSVKVQTSAGWQDLDIGSAVAPDAQIRISNNGVLELSRGAERFSLLKDGQYSIAAVLRSAGKASRSGAGMTLVNELRTLVQPGGASAGTVAGVRGAAQGNSSDGMVWMGGVDDTTVQVNALLDQKRYSEAEAQIKSALADTVDEGQKQDLNYLLAVAYYGEGDGARAYRTLLTLGSEPSSTHFSDSIILKAEILLDSGSYQDGLNVLKDFLAAKPRTGYAQLAYLLSAQCYLGLGDKQAAGNALDSGYALDPQTDAAKQIQKLRQN